MENTGERQISPTLSGIKGDHKERYTFAANWLISNLGITSVLDGACGIGYGSFIMGLSGHVVTGVDKSEETINAAREHYQFPCATYVHKDLTEMELETGVKFGAVVSFETIEHIEDPEPVLKKFREVSDTLIASVPNQDVVPFSKETHPFHFRHYTPDEFEKLLERCGYEITGWYTQYDKVVGHVSPGDNGRTLIVTAKAVS